MWTEVFLRGTSVYSIPAALVGVLGVELHVLTALLLLPIAAIGHIIGLKAHDMILKNDQWFKRIIGGMLLIISVIGLWQL